MSAYFLKHHLKVFRQYHRCLLRLDVDHDLTFQEYVQIFDGLNKSHVVIKCGKRK